MHCHPVLEKCLINVVSYVGLNLYCVCISSFTVELLYVLQEVPFLNLNRFTYSKGIYKYMIFTFYAPIQGLNLGLWRVVDRCTILEGAQVGFAVSLSLLRPPYGMSGKWNVPSSCMW